MRLILIILYNYILYNIFIWINIRVYIWWINIDIYLKKKLEIYNKMEKFGFFKIYFNCSVNWVILE